METDNDHDPFVAAAESMYDVKDPSRTLTSVLDCSSDSFPHLMHIGSEFSREPWLHSSPATRIYEHRFNPEAVEVLALSNHTQRSTRVVCKVACSPAGKAELLREAAFYEAENVMPFRGGEIPQYFGLFRTPTLVTRALSGPGKDLNCDAINATMLCMVLEHCGTPLRNEYRELRSAPLRVQ